MPPNELIDQKSFKSFAPIFWGEEPKNSIETLFKHTMLLELLTHCHNIRLHNSATTLEKTRETYLEPHPHFNSKPPTTTPQKAN